MPDHASEAGLPRIQVPSCLTRLAVSVHSSQALLETLDGILQQAGLSQDAAARDGKKFRPSAIAQRVAELFRPLARRKSIQIELRANSDAEVMGNPGQIQQVLANLVSNSVKFTQSGTVTIEVRPPQVAEANWTFVVTFNPSTCTKSISS